MKRLFGFCALLLFAGHAMAACNTAALSGSFIGKTSGSIGLNLAPFSSIASARMFGNGQGEAEIWANFAGLTGPVVHLTHQPITYTVTNAADGSSNCVWKIIVVYGNFLQLSYIGVMGPDADEIFVYTETPATSVTGIVKKTAEQP